MPEESEYEVGYGKPPMGSRWKPGQSGNPKGRPRKSTSLEDLVREELDRHVEIREDGATRKITKREALAKSLVNASLKDLRLAQRLMPMLLESTGSEPEIDEQDLETLRRFMAQMQSRGDPSDETDGAS